MHAFSGEECIYDIELLLLFVLLLIIYYFYSDNSYSDHSDNILLLFR